MKCPHCRANHKYKNQGRVVFQRGMKCHCGYQFVFARKADGVTDGRMMAVIRKASRNGTYYFTPNQFYATMVRNPPRSREFIVASVLALLCIGFAGYLYLTVRRDEMCCAAFPLFPALLLGLFAFSKWMGPAPPARSEALSWLTVWDKHNQEEKLIKNPILATPPPEWKEPDIYDYGVERILIVDQRLTVDLLVMNGVHAQERALILALEEGEEPYPRYLLDAVRKQLRESPGDKLFLLHGSDRHGRELADRTKEQFKVDDDQIVDLGLFPEDVARLSQLQKVTKANPDAPVDYLPMHKLVPILSACFTSEVALFALLGQADAAERSGGGGFGVSGDFG